MYRLFLQSLGYARDLDVSELEITLEKQDRLGQFKAKYAEIFAKSWDEEKGLIALAMQQASRVMHELEPETFVSRSGAWRTVTMSESPCASTSSRVFCAYSAS